MQINIDIEENLYRKLKENAKKNYRTIKGELNLLLQKALEKSNDFDDDDNNKNNKKENNDLWD